MKEALKLALEALENMHIVDFPVEDLCNWNKAITAIKEALEKPEQEPIFTLDYLQGHQDGLDWAAELVVFDDPRTGDWMYDDRHDLANAIHRGPEMPKAQPEQEPVAWLWVVDGKHHNVTFGGANSNTPKDWTVLPLYTHPPVPTTQPEPLDTPLPCDVKVGHVTIRKGVALSVLIARMQVLYDMAQPKEPEQEQSGFFSREAMKAHSDFHVAQPEQEPVAIHQVFIDAGWQDKNESDLWMYGDEHCWQKRIVYTTPPQRKPLTNEQRREIAFRWRDGNGTASEIIDMVEAAHGIKGD